MEEERRLYEKPIKFVAVFLAFFGFAVSWDNNLQLVAASIFSTTITLGFPRVLSRLWPLLLCSPASISSCFSMPLSLPSSSGWARPSSLSEKPPGGSCSLLWSLPLMETGGASRKPTVTPKAVIHQKYGSKACYTIEEVHEPPQNGCPGLAIAQKGACLFRCNLELPEISVMSGTFKRKRDAEQSAAELAIEKLGIHTRTNDLTAEESCYELVARINYLFSNEFLLALHPLSGHFRDAVLREGDLHCLVPISVIVAYDARICNLSKWIDPRVESNPYLVIPCILRAAAKLSESLSVPKGQLSIRRKNPYPSEVIMSSVIKSSLSPERSLIEVIRISHFFDKPVESIILDLSRTGYYLDLIAKELELCDAAKVFISRPVGRASSETRLYFAASKTFLSDLAAELLESKEALHFEEPLNARATYLCGQDIYGDAILANIGYTWKSKDLFHENISLQSYYRMLINKTPSGIYKLSREAVLTAHLPSTFTTKANWRGAFPRDVLCMFCRQQRLSEPLISVVSVKESSKSSDKQNLQVTDSAAVEQDHANGGTIAEDKGQRVESEDTFRCEVRIYSKSQVLILECSPKDVFKKQFDSIQNVSLRVLLWLDAYFKDLHVPLESLTSYADALVLQFNTQRFLEELASCRPVHSGLNSKVQGEISHKSNDLKLPCNYLGCGDSSLTIQGLDSGISPSNGSLVCISYNVALKADGMKVCETIENNDEFEFEIGSGCVIPCLEAIVQQMAVGQSVCFSAELAPREFILAATLNCARILHLLDSNVCCLEYSCSLLRVTEPLEDRMEQALFSPPLSKQRVEFAVKYIKESHACTLVDFGCGSGSLLDSLLNYQTSLEKIVGVDISQKSLSRAAKILHSKLSTEPNSVPRTALKSAVLYDGSITDFDPQLCDFDIATCLEVIEHMEEDQAYRFGNLVLSSFCPKLLVISTPNFEYNVILQGSSLSSQEGEDSDDKTQLQSCKFRNHDHKFEWTREQFNHWARDLATRHNYSVEFSGVGGSGHLEPGYASQIAIFRRSETRREHPVNDTAESAHKYQVIWQWNSSKE